VIHEALKSVKWEFPKQKLNSRAWLSYQLCLQFFENGVSLHTRFESPKLLAKETRLWLSCETSSSYKQMFLSRLCWGCKGLSMPTADRVVVIPDSVLMVPGTTACGGPGFHVGWSLFRRVIQFGIFKNSLCYKIFKVHLDMQYQGAQSCNELSLLHLISFGLCSQWDSAIPCIRT
jgi:hypothetical protein